MAKTWLDKLCEPLEHPKYPQMVGTLVEYDVDGTILGKCAEGEIACQNDIQLSWSQNMLYTDQLESLGIPLDIISPNLPRLPMEHTSSFVSGTSIGRYIIDLNDNGFTYYEIADFLRTTFEDAV